MSQSLEQWSGEVGAILSYAIPEAIAAEPHDSTRAFEIFVNRVADELTRRHPAFMRSRFVAQVKAHYIEPSPGKGSSSEPTPRGGGQQQEEG